MIATTDVCRHGKLGAMRRREKLYSHQRSTWRREYAERGVAGLRKSAQGPGPAKTTEQRLNEPLRREHGRLQRKLEMANDCLELQKKALSMLDRLRTGSEV